MRILHVIPSLSPRRGGPSFALRAMAESVAGQGVAVDVVTTDDDGPEHLRVPLEQPIVERGVTYRYFRRQTSFYTFSWPFTRWLARNIADYDLLHIHALFSYTTFPAAWLASYRRIPYILRPVGTLSRWGLSTRRPTLKKLSFRCVEGPILARAALIHYTSEMERSEAEVAGLRYPGIVMPIGIDLTVYASLPSADAFLRDHPDLANRQLILFLSRLDPKKGLDILLQAFAQVAKHHSDVRLLLVGEGEPDHVAGLRLQAEALGISSKVVWLGALYEDAKLAVQAAADIFVLPSYSENFGLAVVEALAAGLPVVISDQVGIHGMVAEAKAGLVIPCTVTHLAQALESLLTNPDQRQQMAESGRRLASEQFSCQSMGDNLRLLYLECIESSGR